MRDRLGPLVLRRRLAICGIVLLEMLYSARPAAVEGQLSELRRSLIQIEVAPADFGRAAGVMVRLAAGGRHRSAGLADLLTAACAERSGLVLLHYDSDFEAIAALTGQRAEWVVPRGSVP